MALGFCNHDLTAGNPFYVAGTGGLQPLIEQEVLIPSRGDPPMAGQLQLCSIYFKMESG